MSKVIQGKVVKEGYVGWNGWEENVYLENGDINTIKEALEEFEGQEVKITIEVVK